jgi:acetyl-CoA C-acetyltransferase
MFGKREMTMTASIVGWAHTPFGKLEQETVESLIVRVATDALVDAGIGPGDVDEIVLGHFNAGFSQQDFTASLVLQADPALRFKPATRVENACATGSAAVHQAIKAIRAGAARVVLVVGVEQMTRTPGPEVAKNLLKASYLPEDGDTAGGFAGVFGKIAEQYFQRYGDQSDALAMIAAKNHRNGVANPYAHSRRTAAPDSRIGMAKPTIQQARDPAEVLWALHARNGSCVTSVAGPHGCAQLYER